MNAVELHQAWMWDCPDCGRENFARAIRAELTQEEALEMARQFGHVSCDFDPPEGYRSSFVMSPSEVTCSACGVTFESGFCDDGEIEDE